VGVKHSRSAIATWVTDGEAYYIADAWAGRVEFPGLVEIVKTKILEQRPLVVLVEDAASGTPLVQELRRWNAGIQIEAIPPTAAKGTRAEAATPLFKNQKVALPANEPWLDDWVKEHLRFPGKPNDQVDTTSLALTYLHEKVLEEQARRQRERSHEEWVQRNATRLQGWIGR
jgi:predicted phage terminase large subunit-like protein